MVVSNKFSRHLQQLYPANLLKIVANFEALDVCVTLKFSIFEQFELVNISKLIVVNIPLRRLLARIIKWSFKMNCNVVWFCLLVRKDSCLDVIDNFGV